MTISINALFDIIKTDTLVNIRKALTQYLKNPSASLNACQRLCEQGNARQCRTLFTIAIESGNLGTVQLFVDFGANLNFGGSHFTPMMLAVTNGYVSIVEFLLSAKADPDSKSFSNSYHYTAPIGMLGVNHAPMNRIDIANLLLNAKADINICSYMFPHPVNAFTHAIIQLKIPDHLNTSYTIEDFQSHIDYPISQWFINNNAICIDRYFIYLNDIKRRIVFALFKQADRFFQQLRICGFPFIKQPIAEHNSIISKPAKPLGFAIARCTTLPSVAVKIIADYLYQRDRVKTILFSFKSATTNTTLDKMPDVIPSYLSYYLKTTIIDESTQILSDDDSFVSHTKKRKASFCNVLMSLRP